MLVAVGMVAGTIGAKAGVTTYNFTSLTGTMAISTTDSYTAANDIKVYQGTNPEFGGIFYFSACSGNTNKNTGWWWRDKSYGVNWNAASNAGKSTMSIKGLTEGDKVSVTIYNGNLTLLSNNVKDHKTEDVIFAAKKNKTATTVTVTISADGNLDLLGAYCGIQKVAIESDNETVSSPLLSITKVIGNSRLISINSGSSSVAENNSKTYYTLDGTDPTNTSSEYTDPITIDETTTIKAITISSSGKTSVISSLNVEAGVPVELNKASFTLALSENNDMFSPTISSTINNTNVLCSPVAIMKYSFTTLDGTEEEVSELPYTIKEKGVFKAIASAEGYESSIATYTFSNINYKKVENKTINFATVSENNLTEELGDTWSVDANTARWANWSKTGGKNADLTDNGGETYYKAKSATSTQKDYLEIPNSCYLLFGYGVGMNQSNDKSVTFTVDGMNGYFAQFVGVGPSATTETVEITSDKYAYNGIKNSNVLKTVYVYIPMIEKSVAIGDAGYATYVTATNTTVPTDVTAYTVTTANNKVELHEIASDAVIKSGTAILLKATKGNYNFTTSVEDVTELPSNALVPATTDVTATGNEYALTKQDGKVGFAQVEAGVVIPAGKAYLVVDNSDESAAKFFSFDNGEVTGINNVNTVDADNNAYYTLQGLKTQKPVKGMYIHNGKKVILK